MKRVLFLSIILIVIIFSVQNLFAMPLVFKTTKELKTGGEILAFDTSKYRNIRIGMSIISGGGNDATEDVRVEAIEDGDSMFIDYMGIYKHFPSRTIALDSVPSKIRLTTPVAGIYRIFIWASN